MFRIFFLSNKTFEGILPGEKTLFLVRKHKIFFYFPIFIFVFLAILPLMFLNLINENFYNQFSDLTLFLYVIYLAILWIILFYDLMIYSLTTLIVTTKRIIKIEEKGFFNYERSELELDKIQDITVNIFGFFAGFLNFGDILIQTAGTETKFIIKSLYRPLKIKDEILKIKSQL